MSPGAVELVSEGGGGAGESLIGMSPPIATTEIRHANVMAANKRLICSPSISEDARILTSERIEQLRDVLATWRSRRLISSRFSKFSSTHFERPISHEDDLA